MTSLEDRIRWSRNESDSPIDFYRKHHAGLTRGQLKTQDQSLYKRLRKDGLLSNVPFSSKFGDDPVAYYQQHYAGLTRGKLRMQNPSLYKRLRRDGLLDIVPTKYSKSR